MTSRKLLFALSIFTFALAACAPQKERIASAAAPAPDWAFEKSDVPVDPGYRFGRLANGMRYVTTEHAWENIMHRYTAPLQRAELEAQIRLMGQALP